MSIRSMVRSFHRKNGRVRNRIRHIIRRTTIVSGTTIAIVLLLGPVTWHRWVWGTPTPRHGDVVESMPLVSVVSAATQAPKTHRGATSFDTERSGLQVKSIITAYSSTPDQTDNTPFITAKGTHVRDGIVANNCLLFGTNVMINGKRYVVEDRMNKKYGCDRFDVWMSSRDAALQWGRKLLTVDIL